MGPTELAAARGQALELLRGWMDRERAISPTSEVTFLKDVLLRRMMARQSYSMELPELNGSVMSYMESARFVEYRVAQPDGPRSDAYLSWRITHDGLQVLEGYRTDPGIAVL